MHATVAHSTNKNKAFITHFTAKQYQNTPPTYQRSSDSLLGGNIIRGSCNPTKSSLVMRRTFWNTSLELVIWLRSEMNSSLHGETKGLPRLVTTYRTSSPRACRYNGSWRSLKQCLFKPCPLYRISKLIETINLSYTYMYITQRQRNTKQVVYMHKSCD